MDKKFKNLSWSQTKFWLQKISKQKMLVKKKNWAEEKF